jgi:hypothetical protein
MKKHAYLIMVHNNFNILDKLLQILDDSRNDIYLHIDCKVNHIDFNTFRKNITKSKLYLFQKYNITWGGNTSIQCELFLLRTAAKHHYEYYHLISGADFPLKNQNEIHSFFEQNKGKEFIQINDAYLHNNAHIYRRLSLYHFLQDYKNRTPYRLINSLISFLDKSLLGIQVILRVDRIKRQKIVLKYGSNWFSVTDELVQYVLQKSHWILSTFQKTKCADELFLQTAIYDSPFMNALYNNKFDGNYQSNMRLIDFDRSNSPEHPHIWTLADFDELTSSDFLFARKFDEKVDYKIIERLYDRLLLPTSEER